MAQQVIGIGTIPNDGTGDPARTAFGKVNSNFTELYAGLSGTGWVISPASNSDGTNTLVGSLRAFLGNNAQSGDDSAVLVGRGLSGSYSTGAHGFRDESTYTSPSGTGLFGYSSFDSIPAIGGNVHWNHAHSYQSRVQYSGSGTIDEIAGFTQQLTHNGAGTVSNLYGLRMSDALGAGPINFQAALWCDPLTRGASNYCIYSASFALHSYHGGLLQLGNGLQIDKPNSAISALIVNANGGNFSALLKGDTANPCLFGLQDGNTGNRIWQINNGSLATGWLTFRDNTAGKNRLSLDTNGSLVILLPDGGDALTVNGVAGRNAIVSAGPIKLNPVTVASLPTIGSGGIGAGSKAFVSDATATIFATIVAGGGANNVPVYCDGTNWRIG